MRRIKVLISAKPGSYHFTMIWAACCTALFGFLHCGEFTLPSHSAYDPTIHHSFKDVAVDNRNSPSFIRLTVKQSKTDRFRQENFVYLGKTSHEVCPVEVVLLYLAIRGAAPGPLFLSENLKPLTRVEFNSAVSSLLRELGLQASQYNTHSFRIGAATSVKEAGVSDIYVKKLGRWQSDAFQQYVKPPPAKLAAFSKVTTTQAIVQALHDLRSFDVDHHVETVFRAHKDFVRQCELRYDEFFSTLLPQFDGACRRSVE